MMVFGKWHGFIRRKLTIVFLATVLGFSGSRAQNDSIQKLSFPPPPDMERTEVYTVPTVPHPESILVLCPGCNGSGEGLVKQAVWQKFAKENRLGLVGISFATPSEFLNGESNHGYYIASKGSGQVLLDAIQRIYGKKLPLLLYGVSGGAHFTSRFVEWKPETVKAWCAYSAAWWDEPRKNAVAPPGIVGCGDYDASRYGVSFIFFKQGRAAGKPWLWVSLPRTGHCTTRDFEDFVRKYFSAVLNTPPSEGGQWVDVDLRKTVSSAEAEENRSVSGWLPDARLLDRWRKIHEP